jgi:peptidoglycan/xylan/chitin deacetylase (PgdA/CDA1 family)
VTLRSMVRGAAERAMCALPRRTRPGDRLILAYHNIVPAGWAPCGDRSLHLPIDKFEAQLRMIRNEAEIVPLKELLTTDAPDDRRVAITFDDAYSSALRLGVQACASASAPCTVFVAPGLLDTVPVWDRAADAGMWTSRDRERFLWEARGSADHSMLSSLASGSSSDPNLRIATEDELRSAVAHAGVTLGNHTMSHANLGALTTKLACEELSAADAWIKAFAREQMTPVVAYPFGIPPQDPSSAIPVCCGNLGLKVMGGWFSALPNPLELPRWNVAAGVSMAGFAVRLRGHWTGYGSEICSVRQSSG